MESFVPRSYGNRSLQLGWFLFPALCVLIATLIWWEIPDSVKHYNKPEAVARDSQEQRAELTAEQKEKLLQRRQQLVLSALVFAAPLCWAFMIGTRVRRQYALEHRQLKRANDLSSEHRKQVRVVDGKLSLDVAESELSAAHYVLPGVGDGGAELSSARMIQQLFTNAREMRRDSDLTSQVFIRELGPPRLSLRVPQHIALRLGIFFTFIGLLVGLEPIAEAFQDSGDQKVAIGALISGLTLAFGTSVAGLGAAMLIQLLITTVDRDYAIVTRLLESVWMDLGHTLSFARFEGDLPRNVDRLTEQIGQHRETVEVHTRNVIASVDRIIEDSERQAGRITEAIEKIGGNKDAVDALAESYRLQLEHLQSLAKGIEDYEVKWSENLHAHLRSTLESEREHFNKLQHQVSDTLSDLGKEFNQQFTQCLEAEKDRYAGLNQTVADSLSQTIDNLNKVGQQMRDTGQSLANRVAGEQALAETVKQLQQSLDTNSLRMESTVSVVNSISDRLDNQQKEQWQQVEQAMIRQGESVGAAVAHLGLSVESLAEATRNGTNPGLVRSSPLRVMAIIGLAGGLFGGLVLMGALIAVGEPAYGCLNDLRELITTYFSEQG